MYDFGPYNNFGPMDFPIVRPNRITGEGHGHYRDFYREKPPKDKLKKARKRKKMTKASRRRNR